jgi:hypothetical protein
MTFCYLAIESNEKRYYEFTTSGTTAISAPLTISNI